jgi:hypothetical protein
MQNTQGANSLWANADNADNLRESRKIKKIYVGHGGSRQQQQVQPVIFSSLKSPFVAILLLIKSCELLIFSRTKESWQSNNNACLEYRINLVFSNCRESIKALIPCFD